MLIDLQVAFENYLRNTLSELRDRLPATDRILDGNLAKPAGARRRLFDAPDSPDATPDVVVSREAASSAVSTPLVLEVKYKQMPDRDDVNQAVTYGVCYGCENVVIAHVRAPDGEPGLQLLGKVGPLTVYRFAFDLSEDLVAQEQLFATTVGSLL
jgi:5-methylcytosine-specific restriction enzyme subunit McrC